MISTSVSKERPASSVENQYFEGSSSSCWPFDDEPFLRPWLVQPEILMGGAHPQPGKAGFQGFADTFPPIYGLPIAFFECQRQRFYRQPADILRPGAGARAAFLCQTTPWAAAAPFLAPKRLLRGRCPWRRAAPMLSAHRGRLYQPHNRRLPEQRREEWCPLGLVSPGPERFPVSF